MELSKSTISLLEYIENTIDPDTEDDFVKQWQLFNDNKFEGDIFLPIRKKTAKPQTDFRDININDAIEDYELMLVSQMENVVRALSSTSDSLCVRCNYGTPAISSLFGAEIYIMPYNCNTLPTSRIFETSADLERAVCAGVPEVDAAIGKKVFEMGYIYKEIFSKYPKINKYVKVMIPDTQGPLDITELMWGTNLFYELYDNPQLVHNVLDIVTQTYIAYTEKWLSIHPINDAMNCNGCYHYGKLAIRNDSAVNLSPEDYAEFVKKHDAKAMEHFGGGIIHFCGKGDHFVEEMSTIPNLYGFNLTQPHLNDMEKVYLHSVDKGLKLYGLEHSHAEQALSRKNGLNSNVHSTHYV